MKIWIFTLLVIGMLSASAMGGENWPHWRGPNYNGSTSETGLPESWSRTDNVDWHLPMPGPAASTPIIWDDRVFLTSTDTANKKLRAMCVHRENGEILWQHDYGHSISQDERSNYASPSPVTDGKLVVFFFGSGDLIACDLDGTQKWQRNIQHEHGEFAFLWTFSSSPTLLNGKLYMQVLQRDTAVQNKGFKDRKNESYLLALDPDTRANPFGNRFGPAAPCPNRGRHLQLLFPSTGRAATNC